MASVLSDFQESGRWLGCCQNREDKSRREKEDRPVGHVVVDGIFTRYEALHDICFGGCSNEHELGIVHFACRRVHRRYYSVYTMFLEDFLQLFLGRILCDNHRHSLEVRKFIGGL